MAAICDSICMNTQGDIASPFLKERDPELSVLKEISTVAAVAMPIGEMWTVNRCRYRSEDGAGKRLCLATGIHGDEMMGQLVVYSVARRIMEEPQHLHGTVDIYPMLNSLGLDIGERHVPTSTRLDMNLAFPGAENGTALESMCHHIIADMAGADLVIDVHAGTLQKSEMHQVRLHETTVNTMMQDALDLAPQLIWVIPDKAAFNATLTGALNTAGTPALVIETDERRRSAYDTTYPVIEGIFCKMKKMGMWTGETAVSPAGDDIPVVYDEKNLCRVTCARPGMYVPESCHACEVKAGQKLGAIVDALRGEMIEEIFSPVDGLVFSQRSYSVVYPGTELARLCRKEHA